MRILLILLVILFAVKKAHSAPESGLAEDVLFIDLNNSPQEVAAARKAVEKSGRKLVVLPEMPDKDRKRSRALIDEANALQKKFNKKCGDSSLSSECKRLGERYMADIEERREINTKAYFTRDKLAAFLAARRSHPFSSVVISGHDGTGHFGGELGSLSDQDVAEELGKYPDIKNGIRALHLWGCYTASPGSLLLNWKKNFPNTALITGYEGRAPLGDKPAGWHYLGGVLAREPELLRITDSAKLQKLLRRIPGALQVNSGLAVCDNYASPIDHFNLPELKERCADMIPEIQRQAPEFDCYFKAQEDRCANPPADVGHGSVRVFYELLQKTSACTDFSTDPIYRTYSRDVAIRLVFSPEVQRNFGRIYAQELAETDAMLEELHAPADLRFKDIGNLSRKELLSRADRLLTFLEQNRPDPMMDPSLLRVGAREAKLISLHEFQRQLTNVMTSLNSCVPFNWTEPSQTEKSGCVDSRRFGAAGAAASLTDKAGLKQDILKSMIRNIKEQWDKLTQSAGTHPEAAAQARLELLVAQYDLVRAFYFAGDREPDPTFLASAATRRRYAGLLGELAAKGVKDPKEDPAAQKMVLAANQPLIEHNLLVTEYNIGSLQDDLKTATDRQRTEIELTLKTNQSYQVMEQSLLEAGKIILSNAAWDSRMGKAQALRELEEKAGAYPYDQSLQTHEKEAQGLAKAVARAEQAGLPAAELDGLGKKKLQAEQDLAEWKRDARQKMRDLGHKALFELRRQGSAY